MDKIIKYHVRIPGHTAWVMCENEYDAHKQCEIANRIIKPGHEVYAQHESGNITGPYTK